MGPLATVSYQYDAAGRRTRLTYPGSGLYVDYDYDLADEVTAIRENGATSGLGVIAVFDYDLLGRRTSLTRGNGTVTTYAWDPASRLQTLTQDVAGTGSDLTLGFAYNPAGQITSNTRSNDLFSVTPALGTQTIPVNGLNQAVSVNGAATAHDTRGNMTSDGSTGYVYNSQNLLMNAGGVRLNYDAMWRLSVVAWGTAANESRRFDYDGIDLIAEYVTGSLTRRYVHGPGIDEPLVEYEGSGTSSRRFLHADERGSIVAHSDSTGSVTTVNRYDEYGVPASGNAGAFQYAGRPWIGEIGLYDNRARMYDPRLGRFMQTDPIGYGDGPNLYQAFGGDPVNLIDPSGTSSCDFGDLAEGDLPVCGDPPEPAPAIAGNGPQTGGGCPQFSLVPVFCVGGGGEDGAGDGTIEVEGPRCGEGRGILRPSCGRASRTVPPCRVGDCRIRPRQRPIWERFPPPPPQPRPPRPVDWCGSSEANMPEGNWADACRRHDQCYASGRAKEDCDSELFVGILAECTEELWVPAICLAPAISGFGVVDRFGGPAYRRARPQ